MLFRCLPSMMEVVAQQGFRYLQSERELTEFITAFERCALPKSSFTHAAHVTVASVYLQEDWTTALPRMRANIRRFNESVGGTNSDTSGYHETLTVFWLEVLADFLHETPAANRLDEVRRAVTEFGSESKLHTRFYSFDVVNCVAARRGWVPPDLAKIPGKISGFCEAVPN